MRVLLIFVLASLICLSTSCSAGRTGMTACEAEATEAAASEYYREFNEGDFEAIYDSRTTASKEIFTKGGMVAELKSLKEKYGKVVSRNLGVVKVERLEGENCGATTVVAHYEILAENGKYVDQMRWHLVDGQAKLAIKTLFEYDENGKLYLTLKLQTGLDPKDTSTTKIPVE